MKNLIKEIKQFGLMHGINNRFYAFAMKHAKTESKKKKVTETYIKNQSDINDFYAKMCRYI